MMAIIIFVIFACGSPNSPIAVRPRHQHRTSEQNGSVALSSTPPQSMTTVLVQPTLLLSETRSLNTDNYWIAWKDPNLGYIAASRSGVPVSVPNYPPDSGSSLVSSPQGISLAASLGVSLTPSEPLCSRSFDPLGLPLIDDCDLPPPVCEPPPLTYDGAFNWRAEGTAHDNTAACPTEGHPGEVRAGTTVCDLGEPLYSIDAVIFTDQFGEECPRQVVTLCGDRNHNARDSLGAPNPLRLDPTIPPQSFFEIEPIAPECPPRIAADLCDDGYENNTPDSPSQSESTAVLGWGGCRAHLP